MTVEAGCKDVWADGRGDRFEQLTLRANTLREELHTDVEKMLNDIIKFKIHVQKSLEDYEGFVVQEVERELEGEGEMAEGVEGMQISSSNIKE